MTESKQTRHDEHEERHEHPHTGGCSCAACGAQQILRRQQIEQEYAGLFLNGPFTRGQAARTLLDRLSFLAAADGGINYLYEMGLTPQLLLGDLDSASPEALAWAQEKQVICETFPCEKDQTDGELAVDRLMMEGFTKLVMFASFGGERLDHGLGMLGYCLSLKKRFGVDFIFTDGERLIFLLAGGDRLALDLLDYFAPEEWPRLRISGIPYGSLKGLSLEGLKYPLADAAIPAGSTRLISNEPAGEAGGRFTVTLRDGLLLLFIGPEP